MTTEKEEEAIQRRNKTPPAGAELLKLVETSLDDDKARDVVVIDLAGKTTIADFLVVASGTSQRQVGTMAKHLKERIKVETPAGVSIEGLSQGDWVLIDAGDVVVHIFRPEIRAFYNLEKLWDYPGPAANAGHGAEARA